MDSQKEDIMKWKLGIVGSRNPSISYEEWETLIASIIKLDEISEIISRGATLIRNRQIVVNSDIIIAFPSQDSIGTYHTVSIARELNKPVIIQNI